MTNLTWRLALILLLSLITATGSNWVIKRVARTKRFATLQELSGAISSLIYVVGLKMFVEVAPLPAKLSGWLESAVFIFGVLVLMHLVRRAAVVGIEWSTTRTQRSEVLKLGFIPLIRNLVTLFVFMTGVIMVLKHFNYDVVSLLTALGVGSLAVGLAAKETISNMISGFTLIIDRNLTPGDRINLGGAVGEVEEIGLRSTRIRTGNGNCLIVPNAELVNTKILNLSRPTRAISCSTSFKAPASIPFSRIKTICLSVLAKIDKISKDRPRVVNLTGLIDVSQQINVSFWVDDLDHESATISEFNEKLILNLLHEGIILSSPDAPTAPTQGTSSDPP